MLNAPRHAYTRLLVDEHESYGLDRFLTPKTPEAANATKPMKTSRAPEEKTA